MLPELDDQLDADEADLLRTTLRALDDGARQALGEEHLGTYLTGSFALGAGDVYADVDFLVVTRNDLAPESEQRVRALHRLLPDRAEHWAHNLEGSYVSAARLHGRPAHGDRWLYVDNGSREATWSGHDDTETARWVLHRHGLSVSGPPPSDLLPEVPAGLLRAEAGRTAAAREPAALGDPDYLANAWGQPYEVLTVCRLLYTATLGTVVGKTDAARWCRDAVPQEWHPLIDAAIASRPDPWDRVHGEADPDLTALTRAFITDVTPRIVAAAAGA